MKIENIDSNPRFSIYLKKNLELGRVNGLWVKKQKTDKK